MELTPGFASDWLESVIDDAGPGEITLCTLGPLTNVAAMLRRRPDLAQKLAGMVMPAFPRAPNNQPIRPSCKYWPILSLNP